MRTEKTLLVALGLSVFCGCAADEGYQTEVNFWPLLRYQTEKEGAGSRLEVLFPLVEHESGECRRSTTITPLFSSTKRPSHSSWTAGIPGLLPLASREVDEAESRSTSFTLLSAANVVSLACTASHIDHRGREDSTLEILPVMDKLFCVYRSEVEHPSSRVDVPRRERCALGLFDGGLFALYSSAESPVFHEVTKAEEAGDAGSGGDEPNESRDTAADGEEPETMVVFDGTARSRSVLRILSGLFALEDYEQEASGSYEWRLFSLFRTNSLSLASARGKLDRDGQVLRSDLSVLGPLFESHVDENGYRSSMAFLYGYRRRGDERELRLFHLIPIRW